MRKNNKSLEVTIMIQNLSDLSLDSRYRLLCLVIVSIISDRSTPKSVVDEILNSVAELGSAPHEPGSMELIKQSHTILKRFGNLHVTEAA